MNPSLPLDDLLWEPQRLGDAVRALAAQAGLEPRSGVDSPRLPRSETWAADTARAGEAVAAVARHFDLDAGPVTLTVATLRDFMETAEAAVIRKPGAAGFMLLVRGGSASVELLGRDLRIHRVPVGRFQRWWLEHRYRQVESESSGLFHQLELTGDRSHRAQERILEERLRDEGIQGVWALRLPTSRPLGQWVRRFGLPGEALRFVAAYASAYALMVTSWWLLGAAALSGREELGWLTAWLLVVLSAVPFWLASSWHEARFNIRFSVILRSRLLSGITKLSPEEVRREGYGQHLGRVLETSALESLTLAGGTLAVLGGLELLAASALMVTWGAGWTQLGLLAAWSLGAAWVAVAYRDERQRWTRHRLALGHDVIEKMQGHRTRITQQPPEQWHAGEDAALSAYLDVSTSMDRLAALLSSWPRGWLVVGSIPVLAGVAFGGWPVTRIAASLGVMLLAERALAKIVHGAAALAGAGIAWESLRPLLAASTREAPGGSVEIATSLGSSPTAFARETTSAAPPLLEIADASYTYPGRSTPALRRIFRTVRSGDRVLVDAPSGSGKSTLVSLIAGVRSPQSGRLLFRGFDRDSVGERGWTRHVASAPQFHENHLFADTLAFNLLLGRTWPPTAEDVEEAERLCHRLGLGALLATMPGGMNQMVGEAGWQLSHGERSRVFLARALLQGAEVVLLDESFQALDPDSFQRALACAEESADALLVVAHP